MAAPPADRLWFGFEGEPQLDLDVETEVRPRPPSYFYLRKSIFLNLDGPWVGRGGVWHREPVPEVG